MGQWSATSAYFYVVQPDLHAFQSPKMCRHFTYNINSCDSCNRYVHVRTCMQSYTCTYVHVHMYIPGLYVHVHTTYTHTYIYTYVHIIMPTYIHVHVHMYIPGLYVHVRTYYIRTYIHTYICTYYAYTHVSTIYTYLIHVELPLHIALIHCNICTCMQRCKDVQHAPTDFSRGFWYGTLPYPITFKSTTGAYPELREGGALRYQWFGT